MLANETAATDNVTRSMKGGNMKLLISVFAAISIMQVTNVFCVQLGGHKSEAEITRMTPEQRVEEACGEYARHAGDLTDDYGDLLDTYISHDGVKALPQIIRIINGYDPTRREGKSKVKDLRCEKAEMLLSRIDTSEFRLRGYEEGRAAIEAIERMRTEYLNIAEDDDQKENRYQISLSTLKELEGINRCDEAIRNTLKLKYKIALSEQELMEFVSHMISTDPSYPGWSEREEFKDMTQRNEAGYPRWYVIAKNPEPYYQAYLKYKAKNK